MFSQNSKLTYYFISFDKDSWSSINSNDEHIYISLIPIDGNKIIYKDILEGRYDNHLSEISQLLKERFDSIYISFAPNANTDVAWTVYGMKNNKVLYQTTYDYIIHFMKKNGVRKVKWVYESSLFPSWYRRSTDWDYLLPSVVDIIALNVNNFSRELVPEHISLELLLSDYAFLDLSNISKSFFIVGIADDVNYSDVYNRYLFFKHNLFLGALSKHYERIDFSEQLFSSLPKFAKKYIKKGISSWKGKEDFYSEINIDKNKILFKWKDDEIIENKDLFYVQLFEKSGLYLFVLLDKVMIIDEGNFNRLRYIAFFKKSEWNSFTLNLSELSINLEDIISINAVDVDNDGLTEFKLEF